LFLSPSSLLSSLFYSLFAHGKVGKEDDARATLSFPLSLTPFLELRDSASLPLFFCREGEEVVSKKGIPSFLLPLRSSPGKKVGMVGSLPLSARFSGERSG